MILLLFVAVVAALQPVPPGTLIDVLLADVQYLRFLRQLQLSGLVPRINALENVTLFAPVNLAYATDEPPLDDPDNLLRYFAKQPVRIGRMGRAEMVVDGLWGPLKILPDLANKQYMVNELAPIFDHDIPAKHQKSFVQLVGSLLPVLPTLCDILLDKGDTLNGHNILFARTLFRLALTLEQCQALMPKKATVLLPTDDLVRLMPPLVRLYYTALFRMQQLKSLRGTKDAQRELRHDIESLVKLWLIPEYVAGVNGTDGFFSLANGTRIIANGKLISAANATALTAADGLVHVFADQPADFFTTLGSPVVELVPRKALYALHYLRFVRELRFRNLGRLVGSSAHKQTIIVDLASRDDRFDKDTDESSLTIDDDSDEGFFSSVEEDSVMASFSNKQTLLYRFVDGQLPEDGEHWLMDSKLCSGRRIGSCFRVKVSRRHSKSGWEYLFNDEVAAREQEVLSYGNTTVVIGDVPLSPPQNLKHTLGALLTNGLLDDRLEHIAIDQPFCMWVFGHLSRFHLLLPRDNSHGYSIFLPCGETIWHDDDLPDVDRLYDGSVRDLGLVLRYLDSHPAVLEDVFRGLFLEDTIYSDFGLDDDKETWRLVQNGRGDVVNVLERYRDGDFNHLLKLNDSVLSVPLNSDVLFSRGVVHITDKLLLPEGFHVSMADLIKTSVADSPKHNFLSFLELVPAVADALGLNSKPPTYSLLLPAPDLLHSMNITGAFSRLNELLDLHLVPQRNTQALVDCISSHPANKDSVYTIHTNRTNGVFECRKNANSGKVKLSLRQDNSLASILGYNADKEVLLVSYGCTGRSNSTCVFLIDKPLNVAWFDSNDYFLHIHVGWISVALGVVIGVIFFGILATLVLVLVGNLPGKKPAPPQPELGPLTPTFMRVISDDHVQTMPLDRGYESDDDLNKNERSALLDRSRPRRHGATRTSPLPRSSPVHSAPRSIKPNRHTVTRHRNLPVP